MSDPLKRRVSELEDQVKRLDRCFRHLLQWMRDTENSHHPLSDHRRVVREAREDIERELYGDE